MLNVKQKEISKACAREVIRRCFKEDFLEEAMLELRSQLEGKGNQNSPRKKIMQRREARGCSPSSSTFFYNHWARGTCKQ